MAWSTMHLFAFYLVYSADHCEHDSAAKARLRESGTPVFKFAQSIIAWLNKYFI